MPDPILSLFSILSFSSVSTISPLCPGNKRSWWTLLPFEDLASAPTAPQYIPH
jgi:hypothetical protein